MTEPTAESPPAMASYARERAATDDPLTVAMSLASVLTLQRRAQSDPKSAERALFMYWTVTDDRIDEAELMRAESVALLILREYFAHKGNWQCMAECLRQRMSPRFEVEALQAIERGAPEVDQRFWDAVAKLPEDYCERLRMMSEGSA